MPGTKTLAEIKKQLVERLGYLPDFSHGSRGQGDAHAPRNADEAQKELERLVLELKRAIQKAQSHETVGAMVDHELIGVWSVHVMYPPSAQSDERLIFKPDGTGRYEFLNWILCSSDSFRWNTSQSRTLSIAWE